MKKNNSVFIKKFWRNLVCLLLVCAFMVQIFHPVFAAEKPLYLEDIQLCTAENEKEAQEYFNRLGYIMVNADLNADTGTGKNVYLGYKTTTDRTNAITDIRMMPMDGGYRTFDYDALMAHMASEASETAAKMKKAADGFIDQYRAGSPRAIDAWMGLNLLRVASANQQLGDFIIAGKADQNFFVELISTGSSAAVHVVASFLNLGLAQYNNDSDEDGNVRTTGWAGMVSSSYLWDLYEKGLSVDDAAALDRKYEDLAKSLFKDIQNFTVLYENAKTRFENNNNTFSMSVEIDSIEEGIEKLDDVTLSDTDITYLTAFDLLNSFDFDENTKMGDWFLKIGHQTSDTVNYRNLYPVIESMGPGMASLLSVTGFFGAIWNLAENTANEEFKNLVVKFKQDYGEDGIDLLENMDEEFKGKTFGYTSAAIRKKGAENLPECILERVNSKTSEWQLGIKELELYVGIVTAVVAAVAFATKVGIAITASAMGTAAATSSTFAFLSSMSVSLANMAWACGLVSVTLLVVSIAIIIAVFLINSYAKENKDDFQSKKPDYFFDEITKDDITSFTLYKSVTDFSDENETDFTGDIANYITGGKAGGPVGDLNAREQWRWVVLCYSKDKFVGSPVTADENGQFFKVVYGNPNPLDGYASVRYFDERSPGDMNAYCEKNGVNGIYMHYTTEASLAARSADPVNKPDPASPADGGTDNNNTGTGDAVSGNTTPPTAKTYVQGVIVSIGKSEGEAQNVIKSQQDPYYVFDQNLTPGTGLYTYIGYSLTNDPKMAITDLRVAPYAGGSETSIVYYGDALYTQIDILGYYVGKGNRVTTPQADALFYTKDEKAGSPIEADRFHMVTKLSDVQDGWEPVSYFGCDIPYNFKNTFDVVEGVGLSCIRDKKGYNLNKEEFYSYLYYEPSEMYTSGEKYLSGMFFVGGNKDVVNNFSVRDGIYEYERDNVTDASVSYFRNLPRCEIASKVNLAYSRRLYDVGTSSDDIHQYLFYTWTYNPKRAVSDLAIYQGDTFSNSLPYTMSKPQGNTDFNYVAAVNYQQQYLQHLGFRNSTEYVRFVSPRNTYMDQDANTLDRMLYGMYINSQVTQTLPEGINFGYSKMSFLPTELYISGPVKGRAALTLKDVIITSDETKVTSSVDGVKIKYTIDEKTLADTKPDEKTSFRPIAEMKNPNSTTLFNMAYPATTEMSTRPLYLFLRGQLETEKKYISSISVGSFSRQQFMESKKDYKDEELEMVDDLVNGQAMVAAIAGCTDELIVYNIALQNQNNAWYNKQSEGRASQTAPENCPASYIGLSRTDSADDAVKGVILYKSKLSQAPKTVEIDNVTYFCAGTTSPILINGEKYYLYYTKNRGAIPGCPINDIALDEIPLVSGTATNLCSNEGEGVLYGKPDQPVFIHLIYDESSVEFYNKLYVGHGSNEWAAMCDLLAQGCVQYIKMDLNNKTVGDTVLLGYRTGSHKWDEINSQRTEAKKQEKKLSQESEAIYDIVVTSDEPYHPEGIISNGVFYTPASPTSLNAGCGYGAELYLYYASNYYSERYNKRYSASTALPRNAFSGYITRLAFAENGRVPYNTQLQQNEEWLNQRAAAVETGNIEDYYPWEYVMKKDDTAPADLNDGAIYCNKDYCEAARLFMFAQRADGSVKPAGEITGGFIEAAYPVGDVYIRK